MHPPFYIPPPVGDEHPVKPLGIKDQTRRGKPEVLGLRIHAPGMPFDGHDPADIEAKITFIPRLTWREWLGQTLIRWGERLAPDRTNEQGPKSHAGQPA